MHHKLAYGNLLDISGSQKQRVRPAAQLISHTSAVAMRTLFPAKKEQADWLELMNQWFDISNSRLTSTVKIGCAFGTHYEEQADILR